MLLDCDVATLTVWVNGERKGVMVHPGMADDWGGQPVGRLEGPLRWVVDVGRGNSVAIAGPLPPPATVATGGDAAGAAAAAVVE